MAKGRNNRRAERGQRQQQQQQHRHQQHRQEDQSQQQRRHAQTHHHHHQQQGEQNQDQRRHHPQQQQQQHHQREEQEEHQQQQQQQQQQREEHEEHQQQQQQQQREEDDEHHQPQQQQQQLEEHEELQQQQQQQWGYQQQQHHEHQPHGPKSEHELKRCAGGLERLWGLLRMLRETPQAQLRFIVPHAKHRVTIWKHLKGFFTPDDYPKFKVFCGSYHSKKPESNEDCSRKKSELAIALPPLEEKLPRYKLVGSVPADFLGCYHDTAVSAAEYNILAKIVAQLPPEVYFHHRDGHQLFKVKVDNQIFEVTLMETRMDRVLALVFERLDIRVLFYYLGASTEKDPVALELLIITLCENRDKYQHFLWSLDCHRENPSAAADDDVPARTDFSASVGKKNRLLRE